MTEIIEQQFLDLDWDLIQHLAIPESVGFLQAEQFSSDILSDPLAANVLDWQLKHAREHGRPASGSVLEDEFDQVVIQEPQTAIGDLVSRLRERYMRNTGRKLIKDLGKLLNEDPLAVSREMLRGGRRLADLTLKRGEVFGTGDIHRAMALYDKKVVEGPGPSLGFKELDNHFGGIRGVTFLIAPPKTYKSWKTCNAFVANVLDADQIPYAYSLELPASEMDMRIRCMAADLPWWRYLKRVITQDDRRDLYNASEQLDEYGFYRIEKPNPGERGVQRMVERALNAGATSIFIDQLQYVENSKGVSLGATNNTGDYFEVCNDLRDYSDEIPIFVVHQFNRSVMKATEMPEAQQAKGSAAIEEVATLELALWANKEMRKNNVVEIGTLASRDFSLDSWRLGIELSHGTNISMIGRVDENE